MALFEELWRIAPAVVAAASPNEAGEPGEPSSAPPLAPGELSARCSFEAPQTAAPSALSAGEHRWQDVTNVLGRLPYFGRDVPGLQQTGLPRIPQMNAAGS